MSGQIRFDHIAIAVPDRAVAEKLYVGRLGGGSVARAHAAGVRIEQIRFANGAKLELLSPDGEGSGARRLNCHLGTAPCSIHHVTLLVTSVDIAVDELASEGVECIGIGNQPDGSREAWVRPQDAAGLLVHLVWKEVDDDGWARRHGQTPSMPRADAARFEGARYSHPHPDSAARQLARLGVSVEASPGWPIRARWHGGGLQLSIVDNPSLGVST